MAYNSSIAVIGCAIDAPISKADRSLEELLYEVTQRALADAAVEIGDVDGLVVGSNDQFDGRAISVMAASGSVGGVDREVVGNVDHVQHDRPAHRVRLDPDVEIAERRGMRERCRRDATQDNRDDERT